MTRKRSWTEHADVALYAVASLWVVLILNALIPVVDFRQFGIRPRQPAGLVGIVLSPFLHLSVGHLAANSVALFCLLTLSLTFSRALTVATLLLAVFLGGAFVWVLGDSSTVVVGASGIVFALIGFLLAVGLFRREWRALLVSLVVLILYGGALFALLGPTPGTSWLGHAGGFLSGILAAWWTRRAGR